MSVNLPGSLVSLSQGIVNAREPIRHEFVTTVEARPHTPVYKMHKYYARRPWNVFSEIILNYSLPGDIVLDPFCGGGTTVFESLKLRRKAVGVDINSLATYITQMECRSADTESLRMAFSQVLDQTRLKIQPLYLTRCGHCGSNSTAEWIQWDEEAQQMTSLKYRCPLCGIYDEKTPDTNDFGLSHDIDKKFSNLVKKCKLWFPKTPVPNGDKTDSLLHQNVKHYHELFTKRNLLALTILLKGINNIPNDEAREFLRFAFSSSLKWGSRQSHLRGKIVEGWALHAYWIYPRSLEINVWKIFERRMLAVLNGKKYSEAQLGDFCRLTTRFKDLELGKAHCMILNRSSARLPIPDQSIDSIITDPPYGRNVNYAELSDYWSVWINEGKTIKKREEVVINRTQRKGLVDYERLLFAIFRECYRVLKPDHCLVCTFNSKDVRVVASFILAVSRAGFALHPDGLLYQKPIRAYTTTYHAMQIGAFVGDFVFIFGKERTHIPVSSGQTIAELKTSLDSLVKDAVSSGMTEPELRERAYRLLIPFLAHHSRANSACDEALDFFEAKMKNNGDYFREIRLNITANRRRKFAVMA